jgi:hypothetical protein
MELKNAQEVQDHILDLVGMEGASEEEVKGKLTVSAGVSEEGTVMAFYWEGEYIVGYTSVVTPDGLLELTNPVYPEEKGD